MHTYVREVYTDMGCVPTYTRVSIHMHTHTCTYAASACYAHVTCKSGDAVSSSTDLNTLIKLTDPKAPQ